MENNCSLVSLPHRLSSSQQAESLIFAARCLHQAGRSESEYALAYAAFEAHSSEATWGAYFWAAMRRRNIAIAAECEALLETIAGTDSERWAWIEKALNNREEYDDLRQKMEKPFRDTRDTLSESRRSGDLVKKRLQIDHHSKVIGFWAGSASPQDREHLIAACTMLRDAGVPIHLLILSATHEPASTSSLTTDREWIHETLLEGFGETAALVDCMDAAVLMADSNNGPFPIHHFRQEMAHALGKPIVIPDQFSARVGQTKNRLAFPFTPASPESLAAALRDALKSEQPSQSAGLTTQAHMKAVSDALRTFKSASNDPTSVFGGFRANDLRAVSLMDEISDECWRHELTLYPISRSRYAEQIASSTSDFCFLESCWKGNGGSWEYAFTSPGLKHANAQALLDLLPKAKEKMPVVFWNKEDPMHYDRFLPIAKHADIIFTTDSNKVADYRRDVPTADVYAVPFAAQQKICNPSNRFRKEAESVCFAGSYYGVGHDERKRQMDALLPAIIPFNGAIYDRMSKVDSDRYKFPAQYAPYIRDAVPFTEVVQLYKSFKVFLNVNTIIDSPTMMSRRVYELLACGTPVVSTPSRAIEEQFSGIVQVARNAKEANAVIERLLADAQFWDKISHTGYREVMTKHTYSHRLNDVARSLGFAAETPDPLVSIVTCTRRPHMIDRMVQNMARQKHANCELLLVLQDFSSDQREELLSRLKAEARNIRRIEVIVNDNPDITLGERFNSAADKARGEYIAKMDDDDFYFEHYLSDALIPFTFGDYAMVGKQELFMYLSGSDKLIRRFSGAKHREVDFVAGPTFVIKTSVFRKIRFRPKNTGEDSTFLKELRQAGHRIYAADPFNFIQFRADPSNHTWGVSDEEILNGRQTEVVFSGFADDLVRL